MSKITTVIYGPQYIGKRKFAEDISPNGHTLFKTSVFDDNVWESFLKYLKAQKKNKDHTVIIDKINHLYEACVQHVCDEEGEEHPTMAGTKKAMLWRNIKKEMTDALHTLYELPVDVIFLSDMKTDHVDTAIYRGNIISPQYDWVLEQIMPDIVDQTLCMVPKYITKEKDGKKTRKEKTYIICNCRPDVYAGDTTGNLPRQIKDSKEYRKAMK